MNQLTAIIVDDEKPARLLLESLISTNCPEVRVIELCSSSKEAASVLKRTQPDIAFLDIEMPGESGLELLHRLEVDCFYPIFVTSHAEYAIPAIKEGAFDYLLKPVDPAELEKAVQRIVSKSRDSLTDLSESSFSSRLELKDRKQTTFVEVDQISFLKAEGSYTRIFTSTGDFLVSKNLKKYEEQLSPKVFFRVNHDLLINLNEVDRFVHEGNYVYLKDETCLNVSKRKKEQFLQLMRRI